MEAVKLHNSCDYSLISRDTCARNNCDMCGEYPTPQDPVLSLKISRQLRDHFTGVLLHDKVHICLHLACFDQAFSLSVEQMRARRRGQ